MATNVLVFVHMPKTAGSTFHDLLQKQYKDKVHYFASGNGFKQLNGLRHMSQAEIDRIDIVRGHINYGIHQYFKKQCEYITFLRSPVKRIISHYQYLQHNPFHPLHKIFNREKFSIRDFLHKTTDNDNGQIRALCGISNTLSMFEGPRIPSGDINELHLKQAKEILESFVAFGIQEKFDMSLLLMKNKLGFDFPLYKSQNLSNKNSKVFVSQEDIDFIKEFNSFDIKLYNFALELFNERIKENSELLELELSYFQALNMLNNKNTLLNQKFLDSESKMAVCKQELSIIHESKSWRTIEYLRTVLALLKK